MTDMSHNIKPGDEPLSLKTYNIRNRSELLDMAIRLQDGQMTCLRFVERIEEQVEQTDDTLASKQAVLDAIDKAIWGAEDGRVYRFSMGQIHASRAIAILNIQAERDCLKAALEEIANAPRRDNEDFQAFAKMALADAAEARGDPETLHSVIVPKQS